MKYLLIFLCVLVGANAVLPILDGVIPRIGGGRLCIFESAASPADIAEIFIHQQLPTRREGRCLLTCLLRKIGIQDKEVKTAMENMGFTFLDHLKERNPDLHKRVMEIVLKCGPEVYAKHIADPCDFAIEMSSCSVREGLSSASENILGTLILALHRLLL